MKPLPIAIHVVTQAIGLAIVFELVESRPRGLAIAALALTFLVDVWIARWIVRQVANPDKPVERAIDEDSDRR